MKLPQFELHLGSRLFMSNKKLHSHHIAIFVLTMFLVDGLKESWLRRVSISTLEMCELKMRRRKAHLVHLVIAPFIFVFTHFLMLNI